MSQTTFNWSINEDHFWPPKGRPQPPFGPTAIEVMRSCTLRSCFEFSRGYEHRTAYATRIGIAFHRTLQSLTENPIRSSFQNEIVDEASRRFREEIARQDVQRSMRPREQMLTRNEERIQRGQEAVTVEAWRLSQYFSLGKIVHKPKHTNIMNSDGFAAIIDGKSEPIMVEIPVRSQDGLLAGRIDYAERILGNGVRLLDYKSALHTDLPERYERQLQIYAFLWYETFREWPVEAHVVYPFTGAVHTIAIDSTICQQVAEQARQIAMKLQEESHAERLASPGTVCTICEFRPWCRPFWKWQANQSVHSQALENATYGFEGTILALELKAFHWKVKMKWRDAEIQIVAPQERFPQLKNAHCGMHLRVLDVRLRGQRYSPQAIVSETSEIFLIE